MRHGPGFLAALILLGAGAARAQPAAQPMKLALAYDGNLYIKVLEIQVDENIAASSFAASARLKSYGVLALLKKFDVEAASQGHLEAGEAKPAAFNYINRDGERVRHVKVAWADGDVAMTSSPPFSNLGQPPASREQKLAAADPLTQLIRIAVARKTSAACGTTARYFDGKQLYELDFGSPQPATFSDEQQAIGLINPVRCSVRYSEVAGYKRKAPGKPDTGLNSPIMVAMGQVGGGGPWVIASMAADTKLGQARIVLRHATMTGARPQ